MLMVDICHVMYIVHVYVRTLGVGVCVVCQVWVHVFHCVICHVWLYVCDAHNVYVHMVGENALGVCWVWPPI